LRERERAGVETMRRSELLQSDYLDSLPLRQARLDLPPLRLPHGGHLLPGRVVRDRDLVERVLLALLELLPADLNALLLAQTGVLLLDLRQPARLVGGVGGLVPPLRVAVDLDAVRAFGKGEGVEGVLDAGGVERRGLPVIVRGRVELRQVQRAAGLLGGGLVVLGALGEGCLLGGEERVALGLSARGFGLLGCFLLPAVLVSARLARLKQTGGNCATEL